MPNRFGWRFLAFTALTGALGLAACTGVVTSDGTMGSADPGAVPGTGTPGVGDSSAGAGSTGTPNSPPGTPPAGSAGAGNTGTSPGTPTTTAAFAPAAGSWKRLTDSEFRNTLQDLLGPVTIGELEQDSWIDGFAKIGSGQVSISSTGVALYQTAVEAATTEVFADTTRRNTLIGCTPKSTQDTACFSQFVTKFGRLAWRRPLTDAQVTRYAALASSVGTTLGDAYQGVRGALDALLLSPNFLYRLERGKADASSPWWRYDSYEVATSLAYFLTNSTPDATLLDEAAKDTLATPAGIKAQAQRLLATQKGHESVRNFANELFRLAIIGGRAKDPTLFPSYTPSMQAALAREVPSMLESIVFEQNAPVTDFFTTHTTYVNKDLAALYGLSQTGLTADSWTKVTLPSDGLRAGFLGTGAFLSLYANQKVGSPTQRGKFIDVFLMCQAIPDPPADVNTVIPDPPAGTVVTRRDQLAAHRSQPSCNSCHSLMDPLGLPLENFDAIGGYRATDHGLKIDVSGTLGGTDFNGPVALGQLLSKNPNVASCMVKNIYSYATGRSIASSEAAVVASLSTAFEADNHNMQELMLDIVTSDGYRYVAPSAP